MTIIDFIFRDTLDCVYSKFSKLFVATSEERQAPTCRNERKLAEIFLHQQLHQPIDVMIMIEKRRKKCFS